MGTRMIAALLLASGAAAAAGELPREAICIRVVDGDTLDVCAGRDTFAVRLIGVDTPEKYDSPKLRREIERTGRDAASIQKLGEAASKFTALLVQGKDIRLDVDPANVSADHKDKSGRLLAYVWVHVKGKPVLLNGRIIRAGFGKAMTRFPYRADRRKKFVAAEREAREHKRGLWAKKLPDVPEPTIAIIANRRSKVYHGPECRYAKKTAEGNRVFFPSADAATAAGYRPCKACGGK